jgi:hypothetical protein
MSTKTRKLETARFQAVAEDGELFTIVEITEQYGIEPLGSRQTEWRDSIKAYQAAGAGGVNKISETEYEIVSRNKIVKRT